MDPAQCISDIIPIWNGSLCYPQQVDGLVPGLVDADDQPKCYLPRLTDRSKLALMFRDSRDHVYAFLGHPLAQLDDGSGATVTPDYSKTPPEVFLELATQLLKTNGLRVLSAVEHDDKTVEEDCPSWVPFCWTVNSVNQAITRLDRPTSTGPSYFNSSGTAEWISPNVIENKCLAARGIIVGVVGASYRFSGSDLVDPTALKARHPNPSHRNTLRDIWSDIHELGRALCLHLREPVPVLSVPNGQRSSNAKSSPNSTPTRHSGLSHHSRNLNILLRWLLSMRTRRASPIASYFWSWMKISCTGRIFLISEKGYFGLGPSIAKPGDLCCVLFSAKVPFILRKVGGAKRYELVGEAYIHGVTGGEAMGILEKGELREETFVIC